jgi:hypothetical protein
LPTGLLYGDAPECVAAVAEPVPSSAACGPAVVGWLVSKLHFERSTIPACDELGDPIIPKPAAMPQQKKQIGSILVMRLDLSTSPDGWESSPQA